VRVTRSGRTGPPADPQAAFSSLVERAQPSAAEERAMREAFGRFHPKAVAAYHAGDEKGSRDAWKEYCDEVGRSVDAATLSRLGCKERLTNAVAPPPATPEQMGVQPQPSPLDLEMLRKQPPAQP
jgi:hypothetical protein